MRVDALGTIPEGVGTPLTLAWATDATTLVSGQGGVWQMPASGGSAAPVVRRDDARGEKNFSLPALLPDGQRLIYSVLRLERSQRVVEVRVATVATGEQHLVLRDANEARYLPTGHLLYLQGNHPGVPVVAAFDAASLKLGSPVPLWEPVRNLNWAALALSRNGTLLYLPVEAERVLTWVDRQQRSVPAFARKGPWAAPQLSRDERQVAVRGRLATDAPRARGRRRGPRGAHGHRPSGARPNLDAGRNAGRLHFPQL